MTITQSPIDPDRIDADAFHADLHARCAGARGRFRECDWSAGGYCDRCGRDIPTMRQGKRRSMTRAEADASELLRRLRELASEFEHASAFYGQFTGEHNALLVSETKRAGQQLRLVCVLVRIGSMSQRDGAIWLRAGWRIITAIGRANIR